MDWQGRDGHGLRVNWHGTAGLDRDASDGQGVEWRGRKRIGRYGKDGKDGLVWTGRYGQARMRDERKGRTMNMREEIRTYTAECEAQNKPVTADGVVEAAKDAEKFPALHEHLWAVSETTLAGEARITRAHRLLISVHVITEEGDRVRFLTHTPGLAGYRATTHVAAQVDLASMKLRQLTEEVARSRAKLREFRALVPSAVADEIDAALEQAERRASDAASQRDQVAA